ncbi:helix-turn-helix transcriptional regulator [Hahella sp. CR1]|uniref:winged helix-turn-helix transcriptional regulator n=1 Tax=Hahella sp. CR1 TaxID=2992807 RepID=UPI0024424AEF|nr:helix-turn-helix domain-containing protein [Hahella sp. CR1]MDG9670451.1 helix-turn-helix transcriptional regulator [Hahella sp. CR1]
MDTKEKISHSDKKVPDDSRCPMTDFINIVSGKWAIPTLYRLIITDDIIRFGALQRGIGGITQKELTKQLRTFESLGIVSRQEYPEMPPRVEYRITELGKTLKPTLDSLAQWMTEHRDELLTNSRNNAS